MQTTSFSTLLFTVTLALAGVVQGAPNEARALEERQALFFTACTEPNFAPGSCRNFAATTACVNLTGNFNNNISSYNRGNMVQGSSTHCFLYTDPNCGGANKSTDERVPVILDPFFENAFSSYRCTGTV